MPVETFFFHGWGYDQSVWNKWLLYLPKRSAVYTEERGYFEKVVPISCSPKKGFRIIIAHSLGFHFIPERLLASCDLLVLISSFTQFFSKASAKKMLDQVEKKEKEVLEKFYEWSSYPAKNSFPLPTTIHWDRLGEDLRFLLQSVKNISLLQKIPEVLLFHGDRDKIVSPIQSMHIHEKLGNSKCIIVNGVGHDLPLVRAEFCLKKIFHSRKGLLEIFLKEQPFTM
jgi:pimeloyl-[acyl-carrier protein] methyl ester esterase